MEDIDEYEAFLKSEIERVSKLKNISIVELMQPYVQLQNLHYWKIQNEIDKTKLNI